MPKSITSTDFQRAYGTHMSDASHGEIIIIQAPHARKGRELVLLSQQTMESLIDAAVERGRQEANGTR